MIKKRIMKKGTAMLLAATLSITGMNAIPNRAHAEETVANVNYNYGDVEQYSASSSKPEENDLVGTAKFDMQANGWSMNENGQWIKADINGTGVYSVTNVFDEVQDDPQAYACIRISSLDQYASYIDFKNVTVWFDGKVTNIPCVRGKDGDCRIQLWNAWADYPASEQVPDKFREIKVQFTLEIRDTPIDWETQGTDPSLITMKNAENYLPAWKTLSELSGTAQLDMQANEWCEGEDGQWIKAEIDGTGVYSVTNIFDEVQDDPQAYASVRISDLDPYAAYIDFKDVTVWFDGKEVNIPCVRGTEGDCRLQLWNTWNEQPVDENVPEEFREIKVQFTLAIRDTAIDWEKEGNDPSLVTMADAEDYVPEWKTETAEPAQSSEPTNVPTITPVPDPVVPTLPAVPTSTPKSEPTSTPKGMTKPEQKDLIGMAQLEMQANGWCTNEDGEWKKAEISGEGTYTVTNIFEEVQDDPQGFASVRIEDLDKYAAYIDFKNVTIWFDGKVVNIPCVRGGDKDCRLQLWNNWNEQPVDENVPEEFREIKVQFTLAIRDTAIDWETEGNDPSLVTMVDAEDYVPEWKSEPEETAKPTQSIEPTEDPVVTTEPTEDPVVTIEPTVDPTATTEPTREPTMTETPTQGPSKMPAPTVSPSAVPSVTPSARPSAVPSVTPIVTQNPGTGNEADDALEVEDSFVAGDFEYEVTKVAEGSKKGQVKVVGLLESGESKKTISVPNEVTGTDALKYQVTGIGERAFAGEKVQEVVLGKYVTRIESRAFAKCKKLKVLTCKAKLQTVQKNAFKKCTNKIRVSGKAKKANIKLLKKSGYKKYK